jgi:hypothetical protein
VSDPAVAQLLRNELEPLQAQFSAMEANHPLRMRLARWQALLDTAR